MLSISYYALIALLFISNLSVILLAAIYIRRVWVEQEVIIKTLRAKEARIIELEAKLLGIRTMA